MMDKECQSTQKVEGISHIDVAQIDNSFSTDGSHHGNCENTLSINHGEEYSLEESSTVNDYTEAARGDKGFVAEEVSVDASVVPQSNSYDVSAIDYSAQQNAIDSDKDYRRITEEIIDKTSKQLAAHTEAKNPLRGNLSTFIMVLLAFQFIVLVAILFLNVRWKLQISDFIVNVYIVSVFLETLAGLTIMIKFAFDSQQEVELIKILNSIITNFKKYNEK